jgi:predicted transcriptional regulator
MVCYGFHMATNTITIEVAEKVAAAITRADRTKLSVANAAGIPPSTFTRKINGHADFSVPELARIASAIGIAPSALLPTSFTMYAAA